jgi:hypothetical protein
MSEIGARLNQVATSSSFGVVRPVQCDRLGCSRPAALRLDLHLLCLDPLVNHCLERLEMCQQEICRNLVPRSDALAGNSCFLEECTSKVAGFLMARVDLQNIDCARLLDVLLWAAELDTKYAFASPKCRAFAQCAGTP